MLQGHSDHSYKSSELVALYANKAGPFHNPRCVVACVKRFMLAFPGSVSLRFCCLYEDASLVAGVAAALLLMLAAH